MRRPMLRRTAVAGATGALVAALLGAGANGVAQAGPVFPPTWDKQGAGNTAIRYVAMGDSFASGPGIAPQRAGSCMRSEKNYASLLATALNADVFTDASCAGARSTDFANPQSSSGQTNQPQYDALTPQTTLVTLGTIGGNDVGLVQLAMSCVMGDCAGGPGDATSQAVAALRPKIDTAITEVKTRAPNAEVVVVGYGTYVPDTSCPALVGVTPAEATHLQDVIDQMSDVLGASAAAQGVAFADMRTLPDIAAHTACAEPDAQWIRAVNTYGDGAQLHPSTRGMANWAQKLRQVVNAELGLPVDPWVEIVDGPRAVTDTAKVRAAVKTLRLRATCSGQNLKVRVKGGNGLVSKARFRVGRTWVGKATSRPFKVKVGTHKVTTGKQTRGRVRAKVTVRAVAFTGTTSRTVTLGTKRPRCLR